MAAIRSTPSQRDALSHLTREFSAIRRAFDLEDRMREAPYAAPDAVPLMVVAEWEHLFNAIKNRLSQTVEALRDTSTGLNGHAIGIQASVLESVAALDQLHAMLAHDLGRWHCLSAFDDRLAQARAMQTGPHRPTLALLYVDLGDVRSISQAHGSRAGDQVLAVMASRLANVMRVQDMARHLGGDAFACLLEGLGDRDQLAQVADQLSEVLAAPVGVGDLDVTVRPRIGIATSPVDGDVAASLFRCADAAMAQARRKQTAYAFFDARG